MTIDTYEVTATHPVLSGPLVMELIASTPRAAILRTRMTAVQLYQDARLMDADYRITLRFAGVWPFGDQVSIRDQVEALELDDTVHGCQGHEGGPDEAMGTTVECDGTCRAAQHV